MKKTQDLQMKVSRKKAEEKTTQNPDPRNVNAALGNVLRKYREGRNMTQEAFAAFCGLSRAYYGKAERGEHSLTVEKCQQIAEALGVRIADLFEEVGE